jgi:hypothetical protein
MTARRTRTLAAASLLALVLVTWGRIALVDSLRDQGYFAKYTDLADRVLGGDIPRDRLADVSPGYLWLMVAMRGAGLGVTAIRNLQIVALSLVALFCALAAYRIGGRLAALLAALLVLGSRAALVTATELEPETLILLVTAIGVWLVVAKRSPWLIGLTLGLSAITRPTALLTILLIALALRSWKTLVAALIPIVLIVGVNRALTGRAVIMDPGTVFYEAWNPLANAANGVMPRPVAELNARSNEPDYLHVAYRLIAARAGAEDANRYWSGKAWAFIRTYPGRALELLAWKSCFAIHHYDVYDLVTAKRKALELERWPAIPFGAAFVLAIAAFVLRRPRRDLVPVALFVVATFASLLLFNVSTRQRNPLIAPLAILGAVGAARIVRLARERMEHGLLAFGAVVIAIPLLGIEGAPMREDAYNWFATLQSSALQRAAREARSRGESARAATLAGRASIHDTAGRPLVPPPVLRSVALQLTMRTDEAPQLFDAAIALQKAGAWSDSYRVLEALDDYEPWREGRAVNSVSYYRARAAMRMGAPRDVVRDLLGRAIAEAPGDPHVLAMRGDEVLLRELHDPLTVAAAKARTSHHVAPQ